MGGWGWGEGGRSKEAEEGAAAAEAAAQARGARARRRRRALAAGSCAGRQRGGRWGGRDPAMVGMVWHMWAIYNGRWGDARAEGSGYHCGGGQRYVQLGAGCYQAARPFRRCKGARCSMLALPQPLKGEWLSGVRSLIRGRCSDTLVYLRTSCGTTSVACKPGRRSRGAALWAIGDQSVAAHCAQLLCDHACSLHHVNRM